MQKTPKPWNPQEQAIREAYIELFKPEHHEEIPLERELLNGFDVITLKAPFDTYQVTYTNTPAGRAEVENFIPSAPIRQAFLTLPEGAAYIDLEPDGIGYAIGYFEPLYYGALYPGHAAVRYRTDRPIVLLDLREFSKITSRIYTRYKIGYSLMLRDVVEYLETVDDPELYQLIDGWIIRNHGDWFFEIHFFDPSRVIGREDVITYTPDQIKQFRSDLRRNGDIYPYNAEDNEIVNRAITKRQKLSIVNGQYVLR